MGKNFVCVQEYNCGGMLVKKGETVRLVKEDNETYALYKGEGEPHYFTVYPDHNGVSYENWFEEKEEAQ